MIILFCYYINLLYPISSTFSTIVFLRRTLSVRLIFSAVIAPFDVYWLYLSIVFSLGNWVNTSFTGSFPSSVSISSDYLFAMLRMFSIESFVDSPFFQKWNSPSIFWAAISYYWNNSINSIIFRTITIQV